MFIYSFLISFTKLFGFFLIYAQWNSPSPCRCHVQVVKFHPSFSHPLDNYVILKFPRCILTPWYSFQSELFAWSRVSMLSVTGGSFPLLITIVIECNNFLYTPTSIQNCLPNLHMYMTYLFL